MDLSPKQKDRLQKAVESSKLAKKKRIEEYKNSPNLCSCCKLPLDYERRKNKFCGHSCSAKKNNSGKARNSKNGLWVKKQCFLCGKDTSNTKFCSRQCFIDNKQKLTLADVQSTGVFIGNPSTIKKYLIQIRGHKCEICGLTEWMGEPIPLVLDHINGKPVDNKTINLRLVCGNCNMQLPTFAGKNIGKGGGRSYRKKRYHEGKIW
jgi:hypothetical protein